jgi:hypothetical protein
MKMIKRASRLSLLLLILGLLFLGNGCTQQAGEKKQEKGPNLQAEPLPKDGFKAEIFLVNPPTVLKASSLSNVDVKIKNMSGVKWPSKGVNPDARYIVHLRYHLLDSNGAVIDKNGLRTNMPADLEPGQEVTLSAQIKAPDKSGEYIIEFDMVQELVAWFGQKGSKTAKIKVRVN